MSKEEFFQKVWCLANEMRDNHQCLRVGQSIFNVLDTDQYNHVARKVLFDCKVDCFYDDSKIEEFMDKCYKNL